MTAFDTLLAPVMPILQQIEAGRKKHHNEEFLWIDFVRILVFYFTKRCGSLNALIVALENADPALGVLAVPKMTLSDAFRRFHPHSSARYSRPWLHPSTSQRTPNWRSLAQ